MRDIKEIGQLIRRLRGTDSLRDFAKKCNVSHTTIDNIEKGVDFRTGKPVQIKIATLEKIATATNTPVSFFLEENSFADVNAVPNKKDTATPDIEKRRVRMISDITSDPTLFVFDGSERTYELDLLEFGNRIKITREGLDMSQEDLAKKVGYSSRSSVNKIELGLVDIPQSKTMRFANALGVSPVYLLFGENTAVPSVSNVIVYHRDGKTVKKSFTKEQYDILTSMLDSIPEKPKNI